MEYIVGLAIVSALGLWNSLKIVNQGEEALVATFGRYNRKLSPGPNFIIPIMDSIAYRGSVKEQVLDIPPQQCITRDNVPITADAVIYWRIIDMEKAFYRVENLRLAMTNIVLTQIRAELGNLELDQTFTARNHINELLLRDLDESTDPWGVKVTRVELRDILPAKAVQESMELQMTAERKKRAAILTSEGERESAINKARGQADAQLLAAEASQKSTILRAEGERQQQILKARAIAESAEIISQKIKDNPDAAKAFEVLFALGYLDMGTVIGKSEGSKVMFMDPRTIPATLEGVKSIIGDMSHEPYLPEEK
ncbi:SPFH domain-containing protein [Tumidithrix elongata RA019]|uniref:SPFH domain-containing protein n=1 Tax=Tumidithrix elongata BACA0141 TaxID=2716417 RepID=A0AAW9PP43_9CYAN|nr:SPFH domain-containing protein [Tumidithrix elongata RA019]